MLSMHQSDGSLFPRGGMPPLLRLPSGSEHRARPRRLAAVFLFILPHLDEIWAHTLPLYPQGNSGNTTRHHCLAVRPGRQRQHQAVGTSSTVPSTLGYKDYG
jgi:hypothetical protein